MTEIRPRNLTARAAHRVPGNPTSTRMESGVANCFPGLEWDVRELDRRFFPGLVFQFVTRPLLPEPGTLPDQQGARLAYLDSLEDPDLPVTSDVPWIRELLRVLTMDIGQVNPLTVGRWYLEWFEQHDKRFAMRDLSGAPFDGELVWRMVRGIEPGEPLAIGLRCRGDDGAATGDVVTLHGMRRNYVDASGVLSAAYRPGELTMSMCNPWSHDFRDCACHYWASNHPDVVLGPSDELLADEQPADPGVAANRLDWIRADRSPAGRTAAEATIEQNRPFEMDHFEMNQRWRDLPFVVDGREIGASYVPPTATGADPYPDLDELVGVLRHELAPMELTLALQYLYAYFSVREPDEVDTATWPALAGDVRALRELLLLIAVGEMHHLRWANRLLWELDHALGRGDYVPVLEPATTLPVGTGMPRRLEPLTAVVIASFVTVERPGGALDTAYARAVATLDVHDEVPDHIAELAVRIDTDGNEHYQRFREIARIVARYPGGDDSPWLRPVEPGPPDQARAALDAYHAILRDLGDAYRLEAAGEAGAAQRKLDACRVAMDQLRVAGNAAARSGVGIPFWEP